MTGSGKTGLAIVLLEEALASGIPALILDPKGDMPNLLLNFPDFAPEQFQRWVNDGDARNAGETTVEFATAQAEMWKHGLDAAGVTPERMRALLDSVEFQVFTPGSSAGTPLNIIGDLSAPADSSNLESIRDEAGTLVSGLLRSWASMPTRSPVATTSSSRTSSRRRGRSAASRISSSTGTRSPQPSRRSRLASNATTSPSTRCARVDSNRPGDIGNRRRSTMDELIDKIAERSGIDTAQAQQAIETVLEQLRERLPEPHWVEAAEPRRRR